MTAPVDTFRMPPRDWASVPGNPRQRNTEERARKAKHLLTPVEDHRVVKAAVLPNGDWIKIDGHTRALFWQQHPELAPAELLVVLYRCNNIEEALALYDACDNVAAVETATDKVFGSFRELDYQPVSTFLQVGRIAAALRHAYTFERRVSSREISTHLTVQHWLPELRWLDALQPTATRFSTPVLTAALLTLRKHKAVESAGETFGETKLQQALRSAPGRAVYPAKVREFWDRYNRNDGSKGGTEVDAVEALWRIVDEQRVRRNLKAGVIYVTSRAVSCVEQYLRGSGYKLSKNGHVSAKAADLGAYFPAGKPPDG